jgi:twinkle protein
MTPKSKAGTSIHDEKFSALPKRKISETTCKFYDYKVGTYGNAPAHFAQYFSLSGEAAGIKVRLPDKRFLWVGTQPGTFFAQHKFNGGKMIVITEGEIDALSYAETHGCRWPTVSLPNGAQSATSVFKRNLEWLGGFEKVILMFDQDAPGRKAAEECAVLLPPGKAFIAQLSEKDPNEVLVNGKAEELTRAVFSAKEYIPGGLVKGEDLWEIVSDVPDVVSISYPWLSMQRKTRGLRLGELTTITAGTGIGKSQVCREMAYQFAQQKWKIGYFALEESVRKTALSFMALHLGTPLYYLEENYASFSDETLKSAFDASVGNGYLVLFDHFGSLHSERLITKIRYAIKALDCSILFLDHLSIVVSEFADSFERTAIDVTMTKLRSLVEETGCAMILVSHLRRADGRAHEEGGQVSLSQLRGSHSIAQLSDICIGLERSQQADGDEKNLTHIRVLKNRYSGETGPSGYIRYDPPTGRLHNHEDEPDVDNEFTNISEGE